MLTYDLKKAPGVPLYEALYRCIRADILTGNLPAGSRLPSKRALAQQLQVSRITVETAYSQLAAEGYISPKEKVGFFVEQVPEALPHPAPAPEAPETVEEGAPLLDLAANYPAKFPFSVWSRLQRQTLLDMGSELLEPVPHQGLPELRQAIARHLRDFRGMQVDWQDIVIGAGTDFLYNLLVQLLGNDRIYALEEPGYGKIRRIYEAAGAKTLDAQMDAAGVIPESLSGADVLHFSPSHHFPSGIITPMHRRQSLLAWAKDTGGHIIEDDYDSEFRFNAHPVPPMYTPTGPVIYMNSFSKSLAPSIRIGYMVLPRHLTEAFRQRLGFYGCTVSGFEQRTLATFLSQGHFEQHINRMRKFYRLQRNRLFDILKASPYAPLLTVEEADAGLHFLVKVDTELTDEALEAHCQSLGLRVRSLRSCYHGPVPEGRQHRLIVNYSGLSEADLQKLQEILLKKTEKIP